MYSALFFPGKLERAGVAATYALPSTSCRLFVRDRNSNICFLVDTGCDCSILPANKTLNQSSPVQTFIAANGTPIQVYGRKIMSLDLGLRQNFESSLMRELTNMMGSHRIHSASYHPQSNRMIERFHRHLKSAIIAHEDAGWTDILPIVLLGLRSAMKNDLKATSSQLVYGTTLRLPSNLTSSESLQTSVTPTYVSKLISMMRKLSPISPDYHSCTKSYVHQSLSYMHTRFS
ncbi:transposon Tf2-6 polyprotein [Trichonephila clavipes]|nr:transposon Tf2-6 polyprotein [Trichonephila clavipes]